MHTFTRAIQTVTQKAWLQFKFITSLNKLSRDGSKDYQKYLSSQVHKTITKIDKDPGFRYKRLIKELLKVCAGTKIEVLCVGCRNHYELDAFERAGFEKVVGIDLVSVDSRITVMDMHDMKFADNSFDVIYSADSLEHAFDIERVAREFCRVVRNNGYLVIQMPTNIPQVNEIDRWDIRDLNNLSKLFRGDVKSISIEWSRVESKSLSVIFSVKK